MARTPLRQAVRSSLYQMQIVSSALAVQHKRSRLHKSVCVMMCLTCFRV
jgi:hypothetical protein